ncbi:MAG: polyprenyl synthetase family protein [Candidatus Omnitrophica bacterium]|nr:polyprenyl synthetase family protein [Candidatus Omnitrophota bacterium]
MARVMKIEKYLVKRKKQIDKALDVYLPQDSSILSKAMRYSIFADGKRIRPILVMVTSEMLGSKSKIVIPAACAIELIHTFTLIHDDLPCMDNSDFRRGKLALHKVYGEAIAMLTGDLLLNYAFKLIIENINRYNYSIVSQVLIEICQALGIKGAVGGQVQEVSARNKKLTFSALEEIYNRKTAALICASVRVGAALAKAKPKEFSLLTKYGKNIGFAFQVADDIIEAENESIKKDELNCFSLMTLKEAKDIARRRINQAQKSLIPFGASAEILSTLAEYIINRKI